jgi:hypothetical protein
MPLRAASRMSGRLVLLGDILGVHDVDVSPPDRLVVDPDPRPPLPRGCNHSLDGYRGDATASMERPGFSLIAREPAAILLVGAVLPVATGRMRRLLTPFKTIGPCRPASRNGGEALPFRRWS